MCISKDKDTFQAVELRTVAVNIAVKQCFVFSLPANLVYGGRLG